MGELDRLAFCPDLVRPETTLVPPAVEGSSYQVLSFAGLFGCDTEILVKEVGLPQAPDFSFNAWKKTLQ